MRLTDFVRMMLSCDAGNWCSAALPLGVTNGDEMIVMYEVTDENINPCLTSRLYTYSSHLYCRPTGLSDYSTRTALASFSARLFGQTNAKTPISLWCRD